MRSLVVYESMYGNTHQIATAIAAGLATAGDTEVLSADQVDATAVAAVDLVVVGGPTHAHGMTRESTRKAAIEAAHDIEKDLTLEPNVMGQGLRDWFAGLGDITAHGAAFDTRVDMPAALTGRASRGIAKRLRHHGSDLVTKPESFLVDKENRLVEGEEERARGWGEDLVKKISSGSMAGAG